MGIPNLSITSNTTIAAKLLQSVSLFQDNVAKLINAESAKINYLSLAASEKNFQYTMLSLVNNEIKRTIIALSNLEGQINKKITAGTQLHNRWE